MSGTIKVLYSSIIIENYQKNGKLEKMLQKWDEVTYSVSFSAYRVIENPNGSLTMVIPRSFPLALLEIMFPDHNTVYVNDMTEIPTVHIECKGKPRDDLQENCITYMLETDKRPQLLLHLRVGEGKTWLALKYISEVSRLAVIIVDEEKTLKQWKDRIIEHTDIKEEEIGIIQGSASFEKILKNKDKYRIYLGIHRTFHNIIEKDKKYLNSFFRQLGIGVKVFYEAHFEWQNIFAIDSYTNVRKTIYLTGTASKSNWKDDKLLSYIIPVRFSFGHGSANIKKEEKYHHIHAYAYTTHCDPNSAMAQSKRRGYNVNSWAEYTLEDPKRIQAMCKVADFLIQRFAKKYGVERCVIILKTLEQCAAFKQLLIEQNYEESDIGMFNTLIADVNERFKELTKPLIISTDKSMGKALDTDLDCIITFVPTSNKPGILQLSGRLRKEKTKGVFCYCYDTSIQAHIKMWRQIRPQLKKIAKTFKQEG